MGTPGRFPDCAGTKMRHPHWLFTVQPGETTMTIRSRSTLLVALALAAGLAGCANTVHGVATDVKQTGNAVEDAVK
ncbi:Predicted small secreted protein [Kaistia soli DSM 19436]|uniref:Predicted small secreted protein n=1 Tax=Kaistia soli DSM 19436 TaxID=1122133 RepID=A0A1M5DEW1_9HYPH|nr:Predicted small secreted protein [Kaistia soli DSM 19436]